MFPRFTILLFALAWGSLTARVRADEGEGFQFLASARTRVVVLRQAKKYVAELDLRGEITTLKKLQSGEGEADSSAPSKEWLVPINEPRQLNEPVYEYRSGLLIQGTLDTEGNFVPDLDSQIIDFSTYKPGNGARRIYNLPGKFVPNKEAKPPP